MPNQWTGPLPVADRFWSKVDRSGGLWACWPWLAHRNEARGGYGIFGLGQSETRWAHRFAWELTHGSIPKGLYVLHACDNPPCVNPAHLWLGSQTDNLRDCATKGRTSPQRHPERYRLGDRHWLRRNPERARESAAHMRAGKNRTVQP